MNNPLQKVQGAVAEAITAALNGDQAIVDAIMADTQAEVGDDFPQLHSTAVYSVIGWLLAELATDRNHTVPEQWALLAQRMAEVQSMNP